MNLLISRHFFSCVLFSCILLACFLWVVCFRLIDVGGADGQGDTGPARVPGAEQEDVSARSPVAGVHGQGEIAG